MCYIVAWTSRNANYSKWIRHQSFVEIYVFEEKDYIRCIPGYKFAKDKCTICAYKQRWKNVLYSSTLLPQANIIISVKFNLTREFHYAGLQGSQTLVSLAVTCGPWINLGSSWCEKPLIQWQHSFLGKDALWLAKWFTTTWCHSGDDRNKKHNNQIPMNTPWHYISDNQESVGAYCHTSKNDVI